MTTSSETFFLGFCTLDFHSFPLLARKVSNDLTGCFNENLLSWWSSFSFSNAGALAISAKKKTNFRVKPWQLLREQQDFHVIDRFELLRITCTLHAFKAQQTKADTGRQVHG